MKRRILAIACAVLVAVPAVAVAAQFNTFFPPSASFAMSASTTSSVNGVQHAVLGVNLTNLDLFIVFLGPTGIPSLSGTSFPWGYGQVVSVQFITANIVRVTWLLSVSQGGNNATFIAAGTFTQDFVI